VVQQSFNCAALSDHDQSFCFYLYVLVILGYMHRLSWLYPLIVVCCAFVQLHAWPVHSAPVAGTLLGALLRLRFRFVLARWLHLLLCCFPCLQMHATGLPRGSSNFTQGFCVAGGLECALGDEVTPWCLEHVLLGTIAGTSVVLIDTYQALV
jgi:hypothetical protein